MVTKVFVTVTNQFLQCEICRWHLVWKASRVLRSAASNVHVSAAYRRTDMTGAW